MKRAETTIQLYEKAIGFNQEEYQSILKHIDELASKEFKLWILTGQETFNLAAYERTLIGDGYTLNTIPQTNEVMIMWANVSQQDINNYRVDILTEYTTESSNN